MTKLSGAGRWHPEIGQEYQLRMHKLDEILRHIQRRQETGESREEKDGQLDQQATHLEDTNSKLSNVLAVADLMKELQNVKDWPIQQCRARIAKLKESIQESSQKIDRVRQEDSPGQQRKSVIDTRRVSQDRLIEPSGA